MGEQLNIKRAKVRQLAERAAEESGMTISAAVEEALERYLAALRVDRARAPDAVRERELQFYDLIQGSRSRWPDFMLSIDHGDLLYDEHGLPR